MTARILDGKWLASQVYDQIAEEAATGKKKTGRAPGLAMIVVGDNPASKIYVRMKNRTGREKCSFETFDFSLPENCTAEDLHQVIDQCNTDENIDGILVQLPLPDHLDQIEFLNRVQPEKDIDGLHMINQGMLLGGKGTLRPCTPVGILRLIDMAYGFEAGYEPEPGKMFPEADLSGKRAVVIGRSVLVGKPAALMLMERNATVSIIHSYTTNPAEICREAEILVVAAGQRDLVQADWVKPDAIVIDVGINRIEGERRIVGDVDFEAIQKNCRAITPVPGGVGPMTVAMLMENTMKAYRVRVNL